LVHSKRKTQNTKLRIGVLFGGRSAEHEVSLVSATSVISALDKKKYEVVPIGITQEGKWLSSPDTLQLLKSRTHLDAHPETILLPDPTKKGLVNVGQQTQIRNQKSIDVVIPILHGSYGEDGTIQGLFELAGIAYVGAGVLGSAVGMDKVIAKQLFERNDIPVVPYIWFLRKDYHKAQKQLIGKIEKDLGYPCFVKPANSGSSVGISKAHDRKELREAIELAGNYDRKILVEHAIENAREIEVSVLGNDDPIASVPGEIISSNEFYDYDAKYVDGKSREVIPARLSSRMSARIREFALRGFKAVDCAGMARVDFLVPKGKNAIFLNEINTIPGFTSISMYPKLWQASGIPYPELLDRLIHLALERHKERQALETRYRPKSEWYTKS